MLKEKSLVVNNHFQLQYEEAQGCFVLLYPEGMVQLNQSAGEIMNLCTGEYKFSQIVELLEKKFEVSGLENEVEAFLIEALNRKWIEYAA